MDASGSETQEIELDIRSSSGRDGAGEQSAGTA